MLTQDTLSDILVFAADAEHNTQSDAESSKFSKNKVLLSTSQIDIKDPETDSCLASRSSYLPLELGPCLYISLGKPNMASGNS